MKTDPSDPKTPAHAPPHPNRPTSPLRLMVLLGVLIVFGGALIYDWVIAPPRVKAAFDKLNETILKHNEVGLTADAKAKADASPIAQRGGLIYSEDVQKILGMAPTKVETSERYTIEHYCWWGWIPRNGNYITVLYIGNTGKHHYSCHYANSLPEDGSIPGKLQDLPVVVDLTSKTDNAAIAIPAGGPEAGPPPGQPGRSGRPGGGRGGPKGGRPNIPGAVVEPTTEEAKKEEPKKEAPKTEETKKEAEGDPKGASGEAKKGEEPPVKESKVEKKEDK